MKILFASTSTNQTTGYGRISYKLLCHLAEQGHTIHHFAFQNYEWLVAHEDRVLPSNVKIIDVHTRSKETFGAKRITPVDGSAIICNRPK